MKIKVKQAEHAFNRSSKAALLGSSCRPMSATRSAQPSRCDNPRASVDALLVRLSQSERTRPADGGSTTDLVRAKVALKNKRLKAKRIILPGEATGRRTCIGLSRGSKLPSSCTYAHFSLVFCMYTSSSGRMNTFCFFGTPPPSQRSCSRE